MSGQAGGNYSVSNLINHKQDDANYYGAPAYHGNFPHVERPYPAPTQHKYAPHEYPDTRGYFYPESYNKAPQGYEQSYHAPYPASYEVRSFPQKREEAPVEKVVQEEPAKKGSKRLKKEEPNTDEEAPKKAIKSRMSHLLSEQKRRASIREKFETLRGVLPSCHTGSSKVEILGKAHSKIKKMEKRSKVNENFIAAFQMCLNTLEANKETPLFVLAELNKVQRQLIVSGRSESVSSSSNTFSDGDSDRSEPCSPVNN
eukprot:Nk52_evm2s336 gene=Nk52_evmTU2s336